LAQKKRNKDNTFINSTTQLSFGIHVQAEIRQRLFVLSVGKELVNIMMHMQMIRHDKVPVYSIAVRKRTWSIPHFKSCSKNQKNW